MKPISNKTRKDTPDPLQLDFLSVIPDPAPPMKPIEPSPDGTPPLPLLNQHSPVPPRPIFNFESDPFFNPSASQDSDETQPPEAELPSEEELPAENEPTLDDIPFEMETPTAPEPEASDPPTAEERLLESIVQEPEKAASQSAPLISQEQLSAMRTELDNALEEVQKATSARTKAQQDVLILKTRFAALEAELAAARLEASQANQARSQTEARFVEAEKQWTEKLAVLRRMLDEVEDTRDEVYQKRVPKLLFVGTLIAGIVATIFAYLIGTGQSAPSPATSEPPPPAIAPAEPPPSRSSTLGATGPLTPPPAPLLTAEAPAPEVTAPPEPAPPVKPVAAPSPETSQPVKPVQQVADKSPDWPSLNGTRWSTTSSAKELKVVFRYGIFTRGTELSSDARQDLKTIATTLKGRPFRLEVEGHTDATKVKKNKANGSDNKALGLSRAKAVAAYLTGTCGLPSSMITTSSAGESNPPYPNTSAANQQKNRTVILRITAR